MTAELYLNYELLDILPCKVVINDLDIEVTLGPATKAVLTNRCVLRLPDSILGTMSFEYPLKQLMPLDYLVLNSSFN